MQKTYMPREDELQLEWVLMDASDQVLGRLASEAAHLLRGKHKPYYAPHLDCGDGVIVVNASEIVVTGNKETNEYVREFSGHIGGLRERPLGEVLEEEPEEVVREAIEGMIKNNPLGRKRLEHLRVYSGADHKHEAQQPVPYDWETNQIQTDN